MHGINPETGHGFGWTDLTGQMFGQLTVIRFAETRKLPNGKSRSFWECRCNCGNISTVPTANLKNGNSKRCLSCRGLRSIEVRDRSTFFRLPEGQAGLNRLLSRYWGNAKTRGVAWELTTEEAIVLFKSNCFYCGQPPSQHIQGASNYFDDYVYNGIDRWDSSKGYRPDNVVPCCGPCNTAKMDRPAEEFIEWIKKAHHHLTIRQLKGVA